MFFRHALILIINIILLSFSASVIAAGKFQIVREAEIQPDQYILEYVDQESMTLVERMNRLLHIPKDIIFVFGAEDGPLYDPETFEILMPDDFTLEVMDRFIQANYVKTEEELYSVTMDVIEHTLYHELGHALVHSLEIPITGREEDAVDSMATMLVIFTNQEGAEVALSAADLFDLEGNDIQEFTDEDFWGEHSLDFQRFYNTVCMIYGSDPGKYRYLITELEIGEDRAELCIDDYLRESKSWKKLLKPHLKDKSLLN